MASSDPGARSVCRLLILIPLVALAACRTPIVHAQSGSDNPPASLRFALETNSKNGLYTFVPNTWTELHFQLENRSDQPRNLLTSTYFGDESTLQFGRRTWLPAHSRLNLTHPAKLPSEDKFKDQTLEFHSLVIDESQGSELLIKNESGQVRHDRSALITPTARNTGIIAGWKLDDAVPQDVLDLVIASRVNQGLNNKTTVLAGQFLPCDETYLGYLDHLVIAENRLLQDVAAMTAIRRWLHAGGRLWIMLDRVDPTLVEQILGDNMSCHLVDRIGLTTVKLEKGQVPGAEKKESIPKTTEYDDPVDMARVVIQGVKVWNTANDWPAAVSCSFGEGRLLITTLGARAWIGPTPEAARKAAALNPDSASPWVPNSLMEDIAAYVFGKRNSEVLASSDLQPVAREYISYKVPTWGMIVTSMGAFIVCLLVAALCLHRMDCLEHFGWAGSALAIAFGLFFSGIGISTHYGVPEMLAAVQLAQGIGGTDDVRTHGVATVYRPEGGQSVAQSTNGGDLWPEMTGMESATRRLVSTDLDAFKWEGMPSAAGPRTYTESSAESRPKRLEARGTIDARGVVGQFTGHAVSPTDALLATKDGRIGVNMNADGTFVARADNLFQADQYLEANFLGDDQDRRRRVLQKLFASQAWKDYLDRPQLLVWVNDWNPGIQFGEGLTRRGETLLTVPLELTRPKSGEELLIPSPLITFSTRRPPDGTAPSGAWDDNRKEWQERSGPSTTWLNFQLPKTLLPLKPSKARIQIEVSGPMHRLEILGIKNDVPTKLEGVSDPIGSLTFEVADLDALSVTDQGELCLGIGVGNTSRSDAPGQPIANPGNSPANYWRIHSLNLQVWATATKRSNED